LARTGTVRALQAQQREGRYAMISRPANASAEMAIVGYEGIVAVSVFMGAKSTPSRAVVQSAVQSFRLNAEMLDRPIPAQVAT